MSRSLLAENRPAQTLPLLKNLPLNDFFDYKRNNAITAIALN